MSAHSSVTLSRRMALDLLLRHIGRATNEDLKRLLNAVLPEETLYNVYQVIESPCDDDELVRHIEL